MNNDNEMRLRHRHALMRLLLQADTVRHYSSWEQMLDILDARDARTGARKLLVELLDSAPETQSPLSDTSEPTDGPTAGSQEHGKAIL